MNKLLQFVIVIAALAAGRQTTAVELHVAPSGNDADQGTKEKPFATLHRARDAVRALKKSGPPQEPITVQVHGGTYYLRDTLILSAEDSGTEQAPVVYQACPGEQPILSAGVPVTGWREMAPGKWETTLPDVAAGKWMFSQLYVNDQRRPRAFLPKQGYYHIEDAAASPNPPRMDRFEYRAGDIRPDWRNLGDVEILTFHFWTMNRIPIKAVDAANRIVTLAGPTHSHVQAPLTPETWYRVENVREALSEPGEWYLDRKTGVLTYLAKPGEDLTRLTVVAPRLPRLIKFQGDIEKGTFVEHLILRGLTLAHTSWNVPATGRGHPQADADLDGAVTGVNARHCALVACVVRHTGAYAVDFRDGCRSNRIESCELFDLGGGGVKIGPDRLGAEPDQRKWAGDCVVRDNLIVHGGRTHPASVGVWIGHADNNVVEHNDVADFHYSGMSIGWDWSHRESPAHHNVIADNRIREIGQGVLSDMGGIYHLGHAPGTVLRGNVIHDVNRARYGGWGIYLDACSAQVLVENNLVFRTEDGGLHQNFGHDNTVRNNVFAYGKNGQLRFGSLKNGATALEGNIFLLPKDGKLLTHNDEANDRNSYKRNMYWEDGGAGNIVFPGGLKFDQWRQREPNALVADPRFVNPAAGDFRLDPQSPAIAHGFVPVDWSKAGRLTKGSRTAGLPPVARVFPPAPAEQQWESKDVALDEGFEAYAPGQNWAERWPWTVSLADRSAQSVTVTDETAAAGRQSLKFVDNPQGHPYQPHVVTKLRYASGIVRNSFDLRVEPGTRLTWEWRDWQEDLKTGPQLTVTNDGTLLANGVKLAKLPHSQWVHLEIECGVGSQANGTYAVAVILPGETAPRRFEQLKYPAGFRVLTWAGFASYSDPRGVYFVDNLRLAKDDK